MSPTHKPLSRQTLVITGASSGIGLATARKAAKAGAAVLLVARDEAALKAAAEEIRRAGGRAEHKAADVSKEEDVAAVVDYAAQTLGGFDAWVNDAGVGIYSDLQDLSTDEHRRLFDVNYWGLVYGSKAAVRYWKAHGRQGALINIGSVASDVQSPLLGAYVASKHAVRGFTNSLRIELLRDKSPVSVTLIKPAGIATPFARNAANHTDGRAVIPPPLYAPELVADAILSAATKPQREIIVGGAGVAQILFAYHWPSLFEKLATKAGDSFSLKGRSDRSRSSLQRPGIGGRVNADKSGRGFSLYTAAKTNPKLAAGLGLGVLAGLLIAGAWSRPETRRFVEQELPQAGAKVSRRARKEARRLGKRSAKLARQVRRGAPRLGARAAELARAVPHELPPELSHRIVRETRDAQARLKRALAKL